MAVAYSKEFKKNYESRVDQIILNSASYKTRNNIILQNEKVNNNNYKQTNSYIKKGISLISYNF